MREVVLAGLLALASTGVQAGEKLLVGPPPAWVKPAPAIAAGALPADGAAIRYLRMDRQFNFGADGDAIYQEGVSQIRTAMGLSVAGAISLSWDPTRDTVTVHKLRIVRDGQRIDVLERQAFNVIRREANITEIVDGRLTATLQPEGLRVGDVLEVAYTLVHSDPVLKGRTDFGMNFGDLRGVESMSLRATWPKAEAIAWRTGSGLAKPKVSRQGATTELTLEMKNPGPLKGPSGAPRRYWPTREIEFSEFASWAEVGAAVAPQFAKASILAPDSPLKAEAAKIREASSDPKVQAAAALKLVQDQVRYLGLVLTDGGYTPVDADKTWARRFGECKAKTVLLVALLRELGIEAEPALVNAYGSEKLDASLPRMSAFNHVIARVTIGGKVYWLDGTRSGDGALDTLDVPPHNWALPIRAEGSALIALTKVPRAAPDREVAFDVDASGGIEAPAPARGVMIMRGEGGLWPGLMMANLPAADRERMLKSMWAQYPWIEVKTAQASRDPQTGESRMTMEGTAKLRWYPGPSGARWFMPPSGGLGWRAEFKRDPGPGDDAPFAVDYPSFTANRFTIRLPHGGQGFSAPAEDVEKTIAGRTFMRRTRTDGDRITIETSVKAVAPEFPASEAAVAGAALTEMANVRVPIQAPRIYRATDADVAAWLAQEPKTTAEFLDRGAKLMHAGRPKEGTADFEKAITLDPKSSMAYANRGLARIQAGQYDLAKPDLEQAVKLDPRNAAVQGGLGALAMRERRYAEAVAAFTRAADLMPNNLYALGQRADAYRRLGETDRALADLAEAQQMDPKVFQIRQARAEIYAGQGELDRALAEMDSAIAVAPSEPFLHTYRGAILVRLDRRADADKAFAASIAAKPTPEAYLTRAANRPKDDLTGRLSDLAAAEKIDPANRDLSQVRARAYIDAGKAGEALPVLNRAIKADPKSAELLGLRAEAYARTGQPALAIKDFGGMRVLAAGNATALNSLCWNQAILGVELDAALADCIAALKLEPKLAAIIDSKAFVLLRLGRFRESVETYDEAVRLRPRQAASLYGRGVAKLRLGMTAEGNADLAAARRIYDKVDTEFAAFGVTA